MAISNAYLLQVKNLPEILAAIRAAQAPERFTHKFLEAIGFRSTSDRPVINVLKALGFIDESGAPRQRYFDFLDEESHKRVLADGIREAFADLFKVNNKANEMDQPWVKNKLKTLTQGSKGDAVLSKMAMTFIGLCKQADFTASSLPPKPVSETTTEEPQPKTDVDPPSVKPHRHGFGLSYNINIELPAVRDQAVYEAIFKALKDHLL